ncbi:hypothetical protein F2P79_009435 [Pimephales promelas]|nr:hypothetical protein F2P79_009435 [Pimephales promelas]
MVTEAILPRGRDVFSNGDANFTESTVLHVAGRMTTSIRKIPINLDLKHNAVKKKKIVIG